VATRERALNSDGFRQPKHAKTLPSHRREVQFSLSPQQLTELLAKIASPRRENTASCMINNNFYLRLPNAFYSAGL
jgi:hypothetical protein